MNPISAALAGLIGLALLSPAVAQDKVFRAIDAVAGKEARIGVVGEITRDCKAGTAPEVKVVTPPKNGTLTLRSVTSRAGAIRRCPKLEAAAQAVLYFPKSNFSGADEIVYEIKRANGRTSVVTVKIDVSAQPKSGAKTDDASDL